MEKVKECPYQFNFCPFQIEWQGKIFCNPFVKGKCLKKEVKNEEMGNNGKRG
jgi:hypothetical protein